MRPEPRCRIGSSAARGEERALEVDVDDAVEVRHRHALGGDVRHRRRAASMSRSSDLELLDRVRDGGFDLVEVGHVHLHWQRAAAERADLAGEPVVTDASRSPSVVGARLGERGDRAAETTRRPRDECRPPPEVEPPRAHARGGSIAFPSSTSVASSSSPPK